MTKLVLIKLNNEYLQHQDTKRVGKLNPIVYVLLPIFLPLCKLAVDGRDLIEKYEPVVSNFHGISLSQ